MAVKERLRQVRAIRPAMGGGGGNNGGSNLSYWNGKGGENSGYNSEIKDAGQRVLGLRKELIQKFEQHVGVHPLTGGLVDAATAGKAQEFGGTIVPEFVEAYKTFCKGAKQAYDGDVKRKEMQVDLGKHAVNGFVEQNGHDHDFIRHSMSAVVAIEGNKHETGNHYLLSQGRLEMLAKQTNQI